MAQFLGECWNKEQFRQYYSDPQPVAGAMRYVIDEGRGRGIVGVAVRNGGGLTYQVLPGRGMDIAELYFRGVPLHFFSATGITSPAYYEEPGLRWLRSFFGGLLTTCGITYSGAPSTDQGRELGLHGRISNSEAENVSIRQEWCEDEYLVEVSGNLREAEVMGENVTLQRSIITQLGSPKLRIRDVIENRGFSPQPLMMLYHFNFGFPLLSPGSELVAPITSTTPRDKAAEADDGVKQCQAFEAPRSDYEEKVFFHSLAPDGDGRTFAALLNTDIGDGQPLGIVMRYDKRKLPQFTEWKMMGSGCYVVGLEPGTVVPLGRKALRDSGELPMIGSQESYHVEVELEILTTPAEFEEVRWEASHGTG